MIHDVAASVRHRLHRAPDTLREAVQVLAAFLLPIVRALSDGEPFDRHWSPGGLWTQSIPGGGWAST